MPWCKQGATDKLVREFLRTGSAARFEFVWKRVTLRLNSEPV